MLSSYFTQRGEPALLSKWDRAESALKAGVNLVLELPVFFSCHNAGIFAAGAVDILAATGLVRALSFGMEEPDFDVLPLVDILVHEPKSFKDSLKKYLNSGFSYVKARVEALSLINVEYARFVSSPNNALALAYMERIARMGHDLDCIHVRRLGAGYHDAALKSGGDGAFFESASAIRRGLASDGVRSVAHALPVTTVSILTRCMNEGRFVLSTDALWRIVRSLLLRASEEEISRSAEMTEGMENRLLRFASESGSWDEFLRKCVTGRYPRGRVQRQIVHFLLGIGHDENRALQESGPAFIRPLAADKEGIKMLKIMRTSARLPVRGKSPLRAEGFEGRLASLELLAAEIWESLTPAFSAGFEKKRSFIKAPTFGEEGNAP